MDNDALANLRDIHLPDAISMLPLTWGWFILVWGGVALVAAVVMLVRHHRSSLVKRQALQLLQNHYEQFQRSGDNHQFVSAVSTLLRRYALHCFPRHQVAGLAGARWLRFLDQTGGQGQFSQGAGRVLADAPYKNNPGPVQADALVHLIRQWMAKVTKA